MNLTGKTAIVTGGATGIGRAIVEAFVHQGARVIIIGRRRDALENAAKKLGDAVHPHPCDVGDLSRLPQDVAGLEARFGAIDILVNNAGVNMKRPASEVSDEAFSSILQTNLLGLFSLTREVGRAMCARRAGCVLNITSMAAIYGIPGVPAYSAAKSAVLGLTRQLAVEWGEYGVRVNAIAPGFIHSEMTAKAFDSDPQRKHKVLSRTPLARFGHADEVASAALFLCSDAASFVTGVNLAVDGGNSIGF